MLLPPVQQQHQHQQQQQAFAQQQVQQEEPQQPRALLSGSSNSFEPAVQKERSAACQTDPAQMLPSCRNSGGIDNAACAAREQPKQQQQMQPPLPPLPQPSDAIDVSAADADAAAVVLELCSAQNLANVDAAVVDISGTSPFAESIRGSCCVEKLDSSSNSKVVAITATATATAAAAADAVDSREKHEDVWEVANKQRLQQLQEQEQQVHRYWQHRAFDSRCASPLQLSVLC
jgi:hypothetical protein